MLPTTIGIMSCENVKTIFGVSWNSDLKIIKQNVIHCSKLNERFIFLDLFFLLNFIIIAL